MTESKQEIITTPVPNISTVPLELFHYTSISALKGILKTNTLWATRTTHLNDSTEMELIWPRIAPHFIRYLENEIRAHLHKNPGDKEKFDHQGGAAKIAKLEGSRTVNLMRSGLFGHGSFSDFGPPFVVSFTTHSRTSDRDNYHRLHGMLSQWRAYGNYAGVALVFDNEKIEKLLEQEGKRFVLWPCFIGNVVYDEQSLDVENRFPQIFQGLKQWSEKFVQLDTKATLQILNEQVVPELPSIAGRFKHDAFHEEQEIRIIVGVMSESVLHQPVWKEDPTKKFKQIHHRENNCGAIPYIRLFEDTGEDLPITRIIVGPSRNQLAHLETVKELVGARNIPVEKSETPYVGSA